MNAARPISAVAGAKVMANVIYALILREIKTRFGTLKLGYIWAFIEPIAFVSVLAFIFVILGRRSASGMPLVLFLMTGIVPYFLFRNTMERTISAIDSNRALLTYPQVTALDLFISRALLEAATMSIVFVLLVGGVHVMQVEVVDIESLLGIIGALGFASVLGLALGMTFGAWISIFPSIQEIAGLLLGRPLFFLSGVFYTAEMVPAGARDSMLINPLFHVTEMLRSAFFKQFESAYCDPGYIAFATLALLFLGLVTQRALRKYAVGV